jgi:capsular exopolysaccharide synthesis family protein
MEPARPSQPAESKLHFLDYWRIIRIRRTVILAVFLLVVLTAAAVTFLLPKTYMSTVRIAVEKDISDINPLGFAQVSSQYDPYFMETEFQKIKSKRVLHRVIDQLNLNKRWGDQINEGVLLKTPETYELLSGRLDVRQTRNTTLIEIHVYSNAKHKPAEEAAEIANKIAEVYRETRSELDKEQARSGIKALEKKLEQQNEAVQKAQAKADELRQKYDVNDIAEAGVASMLEPETVRRLEGERIGAQANYNAIAELLKQLKELRSTKGERKLRETVLNATPDTELAKLLQDLWATEATFAKISKIYGPEHPEVRSLAAMMADLDNKVNAKIEGLISGLEVRVAASGKQVDTFKRELQDAKRNDAKKTEQARPYFIAKRDLESQQKIRDAILLRVLQETVDLEIPKSSVVEIIDQAEAESQPARPNVKLNLALGIVVGLIVGVGLAFFIEYLDTSVKTIDDVERALQAPVLGVIPQNVGSLIEEGPDSPHAEAYRVLRTNILFSRKRENANTLTVVSGGAGEGKSTTILNLATVFAQNGQRVLLVDSDLRRPSLHKSMKISNATGLTNYLLGQMPIEQVIQTTSMPTLDFLPSGKLPSSSLGILNSPQMRDFIREVGRRYDFVFFDSPPIMGVSDASILASMVDLTLLVIQYRKYPQAMTVRAKQMVEKVGGSLLGVVLNNINISQDSYYYYYSGYYYDYYSKRDDDSAGKKNGQQPKATSPRAELDLKQKY